MNKCLKYGLLFVLIHLSILAIEDNLFTKLSGGQYEGIMMLLGFFTIVFEFPLFLIVHIFNFNFLWLSVPYVIFNYFIGSIVYFLIGLLIGYIREYAR